MEINDKSNSSRNSSTNNNGLRLRTVVGVLVVVGLGLVATHHHRSSPVQSSEDRQSPEESAGLRPADSSGTSLTRESRASEGSTVSGTTQSAESYTITRAMRLQQSTARLKYLDHCAHVECPNFSTEAAWSYDLDINKQIAQELGDYALLSRNPNELEKVASYYLTNGNDDVKEAALALFSKSSINDTTMRVAFKAMTQTSSAPLTKTFLKSPFAEACSEREYAGLCSTWVKDRMFHGGDNVQKTLARYSLEITNEYTASLFVQLERREAQRDPFSLKTRHLRANNAEFGRMQRGG